MRRRASGVAAAMVAALVAGGCGSGGSVAPDPAGGTTAATPEQLERSVRAVIPRRPAPLVVCVDPATSGTALWECRVEPVAAVAGATTTTYRIRFHTDRCWRSVVAERVTAGTDPGSPPARAPALAGCVPA